MMADIQLPMMRMVHQHFHVPPKLDVLAEIDSQWERIRMGLPLPRGSTVAVAVGSRGIANMTSVVRAVVEKLRAAGYSPFVMPAMGSHGGATSDGQIGVLKARGITEQNVNAPIRASMEVERLDEVDGISLFVNRLAHEAGGIVLVNRIKPHTNFIGPTESGLLKMMAVGLGNQVGAEHYHRLSVIKDYYTVFSTAGRELLKRCNVLFGVGLVENQNHETAFLKLALADEIETVETDLLKKARACLPTLPMDEIDLLIVDEMGKDISGEGIDPNVVGRDVCECGIRRSWPRITRIFVRDLSEGSEGSALGIGQADFTTKRLVEKIDFQATAINCLTSCCPELGRIPLSYPNDIQAIAAAMMTLRPYTLDDVQIVHIKNTMELTSILVSKAYLPDLESKPDVVIGREDLKMEFDSEGNLRSQLGN